LFEQHGACKRSAGFSQGKKLGMRDHAMNHQVSAL
jgi:hypothetical protein